jgi:hypothetical protein
LDPYIALQCKVRVLQLICVGDTCPDILSLDGHAFFISQYVKKLELENIDDMVPRFLDFSCCPFLEDLEIVYCALAGPILISSQSVSYPTGDEEGRFTTAALLTGCRLNLDVNVYRVLVCSLHSTHSPLSSTHSTPSPRTSHTPSLGLTSSHSWAGCEFLSWVWTEEVHLQGAV